MTAFRHRDYLIFWIGALVSTTGSWLQSLTVPYVLFHLTGSALWVGIASAAQWLPVVLVGPIGGSLADRYSRRRVLLVTQSGMALVAAVMCLCWGAGWHSSLLLLSLVALSGVLSGLNNPSWQSLVYDLVPRADLGSAVALNSMQFNVGRALGPAIAGVILATLGPAWAFGLNAASFVASLVALLLIHPVATQLRQPSGGVARQFREALRYLARQPNLLVAIVVSLIVGLLANPVFSFTVVFAASVYDVGPTALGLLNMALGVGSVLAATLVTPHVGATRARMVKVGLFTLGIALVGFGALPWYGAGLATLIVVGGAYLVVIATSQTALQLNVSEEYRGRVLAARFMLMTIVVPIGALLMGACTDLVGPQWAMAGAGVLVVLITLILTFARGRRILGRLDSGAGTGSTVNEVVA